MFGVLYGRLYIVVGVISITVGCGQGWLVRDGWSGVVSQGWLVRDGWSGMVGQG